MHCKIVSLASVHRIRTEIKAERMGLEPKQNRSAIFIVLNVKKKCTKQICMAQAMVCYFVACPLQECLFQNPNCRRKKTQI